MRLISKVFYCAALLSGTLLFPLSPSFAAITGPYTWDANTLHLWHIDEDDVPVADDPSVPTPIPLTSLGTGGGNSLGADSFPGFGKAYSGVDENNTGLFAKAPANSAADDTETASFWNQATGAFTYECIVRIDFDPTELTLDYVGLITMDQDSGDRPFAFYLNPLNTDPESFVMLFQGISSGGERQSDVLSITQGHWYHAAVTFAGGEEGELKFYWTDMGTADSPNTSVTTANLVGTATLEDNLSGSTGDFAIGAEARSGQTAQWFGLIDEVRISDIARGPDEFIFAVPEPSSFALVGIGLAAIGAVRLRRKAA